MNPVLISSFLGVVLFLAVIVGVVAMTLRWCRMRKGSVTPDGVAVIAPPQTALARESTEAGAASGSDVPAGSDLVTPSRLYHEMMEDG
ncbi:MAG: hypothetical protein HQL62_10550, partial [Magnetococcales bacterium]|nr:hypothetical protein [Magnetococcales bacterium]